MTSLPTVFLSVSTLTSDMFQVRLNYVMQRAICGSIFHLFLPLMQMVCATMPCRNSEMVQTRSNLMHGCRTVMNRQYSQDTAYKCMLTHLQNFCLKHFKPLRSLLNHQIKFASALGDHSLISSVDTKEELYFVSLKQQSENEKKGHERCKNCRK